MTRASSDELIIISNISFVNKGITCLFSGILFICARVVSLNDTTRAQINNIPEKKSHVIIIIINKQGQMISRMRVLIIQAK